MAETKNRPVLAVVLGADGESVPTPACARADATCPILLAFKK